MEVSFLGTGAHLAHRSRAVEGRLADLWSAGLLIERPACCNWQGLSPVLMPLTGLAPASPYFGLRAMGQLSFPQ